MAVTFEDVAVYFTREQGALLEPNQKALYQDVMQQTYENVASAGPISKPELISRMERGEELWVSDQEVSGGREIRPAMAPTMSQMAMSQQARRGPPGQMPTSQEHVRQRSMPWGEQETKTFIRLWGDEKVQYSLVKSYRNVAVFQKISDEMRKLGYDRDMSQCRQRAKDLRRGYKEINNNNLTSGRGRQTTPYFELLDQFLCMDGAIVASSLFRSTFARSLKKADSLPPSLHVERPVVQHRLVSSSQLGPSNLTLIPQVKTEPELKTEPEDIVALHYFPLEPDGEPLFPSDSKHPSMETQDNQAPNATFIDQNAGGSADKTNAGPAVEPPAVHDLPPAPVENHAGPAQRTWNGPVPGAQRQQQYRMRRRRRREDLAQQLLGETTQRADKMQQSITELLQREQDLAQRDTEERAELRQEDAAELRRTRRRNGRNWQWLRHQFERQDAKLRACQSTMQAMWRETHSQFSQMVTLQSTLLDRLSVMLGHPSLTSQHIPGQTFQGDSPLGESRGTPAWHSTGHFPTQGPQQ